MAITRTFFMLASPVLKIEESISCLCYLFLVNCVCLPVFAEEGDANTCVVIQDRRPGELYAVLSASLNLLMCKIIFCYAESV